MNDILEFIDELKELQSLYHQGELRDFDFETKIQKYEQQIHQFELALEQQHSLFWKDTPFYDPSNEV